MMKMRTLVSAIALAAVVPTTTALADDYPEKPITMVVAYSPGGGNDTVSRLMAKHIEPYRKVDPIVKTENVPI